MTEGIFILLVWFGGVMAAPDDAGFWHTMLWPYFAGKKLATQFAYDKI